MNMDYFLSVMAEYWWAVLLALILCAIF